AGSLRSREAILPYLKAVDSRFGKTQSPLRLVVACATGPAALVTPQGLSAMGNRVIPVNTQMSWRFSARNPEPTADSLGGTAALVGGLQADLGSAHARG